MMADTIPISPGAQAALLELAARTGRPAAELLEAAVKAYSQQINSMSTEPISEIPGVNPADVWEAASQADTGQLSPHTDVFTRLRGRK